MVIFHSYATVYQRLYTMLWHPQYPLVSSNMAGKPPDWVEVSSSEIIDFYGRFSIAMFEYRRVQETTDDPDDCYILLPPPRVCPKHPSVSTGKVWETVSASWHWDIITVLKLRLKLHASRENESLPKGSVRCQHISKRCAIAWIRYTFKLLQHLKQVWRDLGLACFSSFFFENL